MFEEARKTKERVEEDPTETTPARNKTEQFKGSTELSELSQEDADRERKRRLHQSPRDDRSLPQEAWGSTLVKTNGTAICTPLGRSYFEVSDDGLSLLYIADKDLDEAGPEGAIVPTRVRISYQPLSVLANAQPFDRTGGHGLILKYRDRSGAENTIPIPAAFYSRPKDQVVGDLANLGVQVEPEQHGELNRYLALTRPQRSWAVFPQSGWNIGSHDTVFFALPSGAIGLEGQSILVPGGITGKGLATEMPSVGASGDLEQWQTSIAGPASENPWWCLATLVSLAAPLMMFTGDPGLGVHVSGRTSRGKTIGLQIAASVWGNGSKATSDSMIRKWNATQNAFEGLAAVNNDLPLCLDEIHQAAPEVVAKVAYMVADGVGKSRLNKDASLQATRRWRTTLISTGEKSIADTIREAGGHLSGGVGVRIFDIQADEIFLPSLDVNSVRALERACSTVFGTAGPEFVRHITKRISQTGLTAWEAHVNSEVEMRAAALVAIDASAAERRCGFRLAAVWFAGDLAIEAGVLPEEAKIKATIQRAFALWRKTGLATTDDNWRCAKDLLEYIASHKGSSIVNLGTGTPQGEAEFKHAPRDGWWEETGTNDESIYLLEKGIRNAVGASASQAWLKLAASKAALIRHQKDRLKHRLSLRKGSPTVQVYHFALRGLSAWVEEGDV